MNVKGVKREIILEDFGFPISKEATDYKDLESYLKESLINLNSSKFTFYKKYRIYNKRLCKYCQIDSSLVIYNNYKNIVHSIYLHVDKNIFDMYYDNIICELLDIYPKKIYYL